MKAKVLLALTAFIAITPDFIRAHLFHEGALMVVMFSADSKAEFPGENVTAAVHIVNGYDVPVELTSITLEGHGRLMIEQQRDFLIFKDWRAVTIFQIYPGEELSLALPTYRIKIPSSLWNREGFRAFAEFGLEGRVEIYRPLVD